jgi:hypothetical protein
VQYKTQIQASPHQTALQFVQHITQIHVSPNQTAAELNEPRVTSERSDIHKLVNSVWVDKEFPQQWMSQSLCLVIRRVIKQTAAITEANTVINCIQFYQTSCCKG